MERSQLSFVNFALYLNSNLACAACNGEEPTVDDLRESLILATEDERHALIELLFRPKFNPLDYLNTAPPELVKGLSWESQLEAIEARFRFLAADGITVICGDSQLLSYREILFQASDYLKLDLAALASPWGSSELTNEELEAEIFLHLIQRTWKKLPASEQTELLLTIQQGLRPAAQGGPLGHALKQDSLRLMLEGGSAVAVSALVRPFILQQLAQQFAQHLARRQLAQLALQQGGSAIAKLQSYAMAKLAGRSMAVSAARYGAARTALGFLGPALWAWFAADLGWRTISTNYSRVIPAIYLLAQIRLSRAEELEPAYVA